MSEEQDLEARLNEILSRPAKAPNQCMGCQAGWPVAVSRPRFSFITGKYSEPYEYHLVDGGYPHEAVACTRSKYQ